MKMNLHCFANLIPIMILALFSNSGLINATEVGKRTDALEASAWNDSQWISDVYKRQENNLWSGPKSGKLYQLSYEPEYVALGRCLSCT